MNNQLNHHGVKGQKWGVRRFQNEDGSLTSAGKKQLNKSAKKADLKDAKKFFSKNVAPGAERTIEQAYEKIASNIAWIKDDKKDIENWLDKNF